MDRVQIKGLGITCATDPGHHRLMRGVLRIVESIQKVRVLPDATAILGRTGPCAREAYGIVLPHFPGEHLCHAQFVLPAIAKVLLVEERVLCAPHQGCQGHPPGVFAFHLLQHARVTVLHPADHKTVEMRALPPHHALQNMVHLC